MKKMGLKPEDYNYGVFHQSNARREPIKGGRALGFDKKQVEPGIVASRIGDAHSASPFIGLAQILDNATGGERVLFCSYGSGGSDAFSIKIKSGIKNLKRPCLEKDYVEDKIEIDYPTYLRFMGLVRLNRPQDEPFPSSWEVLRLNPIRFRPHIWECAKCGYLITSLQTICPNRKCRSQEWKGPFFLPEKGKIYSFTEGTVAPGPNWEHEKRGEYVGALIEFDNGKRVFAKVVETENIKLEIGTEVEFVFRRYQSLPVNIYSYKFRPPLKKR
jgi:uncharacterized OB-fold protein